MIIDRRFIMHILKILNELAATSSRNDKINILKREVDNEVLKQVFFTTLNPYSQFYLRQIPGYGIETKPIMSLTEAIDKLSKISNREVTGHAAIDYLSNILSSVKREDAAVIELIIKRDLDVGAQTNTVNKIWPGLIPTFEVMLCSKDMDYIVYPALAELKCDGARCHLNWDGTKATAMSRSGKEFQLLGALDHTASLFMEPGQTWDGELLVVNDDLSIADRSTGNGILNKANKGTISKDEAARIIFCPWDIVDQTGTIDLIDRHNKIKAAFELVGSFSPMLRFRQVESRIVNSAEEAQEFFAEMLAKKEEGAIIKNLKSKWVPKRSKDLVKLKAEEVADLVVVDWAEGTGKYTGMMGALVCQTSDGLLEVSVGSGFTDEQRKTLKKDDVVGRVLEVMYNAVIQSKGRDVKSLFLPRALEFRFDKDVANTLDELK
jgi:hypothetical protein